ncbi:MAG: 7TM diverse intracellular signaling domain-containing protein, partial [Ketobacteraceae bacterium]|nr:7TM diverse intracellular signaling domain-containing protein [Ketobacteraceae bacterium]
DRSNEKRWVLRADYPPMDSIDVYMPAPETAEGYRVYHTGDSKTFGSRTIKNNHFLIPISPGHEVTTYYVRFETNGPMHIGLEVLSFSALTESVGDINYFQGAYFGIFVVMALYNLFLFIFVKEKSYLSYVCFIMTMGLFQMSVHGYAFQFLWPEAVWWNNISSIFFSGLAVCFLCKFAQHFVQTENYVPGLHRLLGILAYFAVGNSLLTLTMPYQVSLIWMSVLNVLVASTVVVAVTLSFLRGSRQAKYFMLSFAVLITFGVFYTLSVVGWFVDSSLSRYTFQMASVVSIVLLSIGLADKINSLSEKALVAEKDANRLKDEFMSTVTHELLTPVNGIRLSLDLLKPRLTDNGQRELHKTASDSSVHLLNLIESMFTFVEARRGSLEIVPKTVRLKALFSYVFNYFKANESQDLKMVMEWDDALPEIARVDESKLILVLSQLIKNACAFTKQGNVTLRVKSLGDDLCRVTVSDTGTGIENDQLKKIFNAFQQADNSLVREHSGLGIGLNIVKDILDLFGSKMTVESKPGKGTMVSFTLSLGCPSSAQTQEFEKSSEGRATEAEQSHPAATILVVEDNAVNSLLICKVLTSAGYLPVTAVNGEEALAILDARSDIDAILMDCQMPVMHGYEATERIRKHPVYSQIPVIAVTANVSTEDKMRCKTSGMDDFLAKPVKKQAVLDKLNYWLRQGDSRLENEPADIAS